MIKRLLEFLGWGKKLPPAQPFDHPRYGSFRDDGRGLHNSVPIDWLGQPVQFDPDALRGVIDPSSFSTMDALLADPARWHEEVKRVVIRDCLPAWREDWREAAGSPDLQPEDFWRRMTLEHIFAGSEGFFTFAFDADDLFGEHVVVAHGTLENGVEEAYYEG